MERKKMHKIHDDKYANNGIHLIRDETALCLVLAHVEWIVLTHHAEVK